MLVKIYCLLDPKTKEPFYVGCTTLRLQVKLCCHISEAKSDSYLPKKKTASRERKIKIREMVFKNTKPEIKLLCICSAGIVNIMEKQMFITLSLMGHNLLQSQYNFVSQSTRELKQYSPLNKKK